MSISRFSLWDKVTLRLLKLNFYGADVVKWSRALDIRLSDWWCSELMVWAQIPWREGQNLTAQKSNFNTVWFNCHTLRHMSYVYLYIFLTRQGNTSTILAPFLWSGCGRVVYGARHKATWLVLQCINGVSSNPSREEQNVIAQKSNSNIVWFNFQTYI
jgi:hypothetical protein